MVNILDVIISCTSQNVSFCQTRFHLLEGDRMDELLLLILKYYYYYIWTYWGRGDKNLKINICNLQFMKTHHHFQLMEHYNESLYIHQFLVHRPFSKIFKWAFIWSLALGEKWLKNHNSKTYYICKYISLKQ